MDLDSRYLFLILLGIVSTFALSWDNPLENWENYKLYEKIWFVTYFIMILVGLLALILQIAEFFD
jgi:hypothetical protein